MFEKILNEGWKFHYGDEESAWLKGYDDSAWQTVVLPHDWSVTHPFSKNNSSGTGYLDGGIGWYRGYFTLPKEAEGKRVRLVFEGVYKNAAVWVNSYYQGLRPFGYTEFSYDITHCVSIGRINEISVKVTHTDIADSRWFTGSGIYRKVRLVIEEPVHPAEYGVVFHTEGVSEEGASLKVTQTIENHEAEEKKVEVCTLIGDLVLEGSAVIPAGGQGCVTMEGLLKAPALWSVADPNLYVMDTFYTVDGTAYLADTRKVGIRTLRFDADKGFFLNDEPMKMKGVCLHHDGGSLGAAMTKEVWKRRLLLLKEMGCNAIRGSHNPHMPELMDLCDEMGFLFMDEAFDEWEGVKNKWAVGHNVYPPRHQGYFLDFPAWHDKDLRTMVRRDRNHPSVIMYSIGNEIDYPNDPYCHPMFTTMTGNNDANKPAAERQYNPDKPNMERLTTLAKELVRIVKEEDDTRPVTVASAFPELSSYLGFLDDVDVIGYNYKEHLYEQDHARFPDRPMLGTENGHKDEAWQTVEDHDYVMGQFLWTGIDYLGEAHGWPIHGSGAGFITTAGFRKENFYDRQKLWTGQSEKPERNEEPAAILVAEAWNDGQDHRTEEGYLYQILVQMKDAEGKSTTADSRIRMQVIGDGELVSLDNGDLADLTPFTASVRSSYQGHLVGYVRRIGEGPITVRVSSPDMSEQDMLLSL